MRMRFPADDQNPPARANSMDNDMAIWVDGTWPFDLWLIDVKTYWLYNIGHFGMIFPYIYMGKLSYFTNLNNLNSKAIKGDDFPYKNHDYLGFGRTQ